MAPAPATSDRRRREPWRLAVSGLGQLLITAGLVVLLFVAYELWWTGLTTRHEQHRLLTQIHLTWSKPPTLTGPKLGDGIAILRIPRLGKKYAFVIVEGTSTDDLIKGPGHYPGTAMPGHVGNFAVAGHRTTYLHPFYDLNKLKSGDPIVLETRNRWLTYTVENIPGTTAKGQEIVSPTQVQVAFPVPDQDNPDKRPTQKALTFTSCNPRYSAAQRIVVHALLTDNRPKSDGIPFALGGA